MPISKKDFDQQLKDDAPFNGYRVEANYIVFDNSADLDYVVIPGYTLRMLKTHNPVASYTKLNKDLILRLAAVCEILNSSGIANPTINSSYRSPEYNMTVPGSAPNSWHTKGDALDLGHANVEALAQTLYSLGLNGELGIYNWGCHTAVCPGFEQWDKRTDTSFVRKVKDLVTPDNNRNWLIGGVLALFGLFFVKNLF